MDDYHKKGGVNRMASLTVEEKSALGKKASQEKISPSLPKATHAGILQIGDKKIDCAVLSMPNGEVKRIISAESIAKIMGRTRPNQKAREISRRTGLPAFLTANNLRVFLSIDDLSVTTPLVYKNKAGRKTSGYEYKILTLVCETYLKVRDANALTRDQIDIAKGCEVLMRAFAQIGLVSLIDEASGFQEVRDRHALQSLLDKYLRKEFAEWAKRFPDVFYKEIFRLNSWKFAEIANRRPAIVGKYTNDIVYSRLLPGVVDELEKKNPKNESGYRASRHHQWFNDIGHTDLTQHINAVIAIMKASKNWQDFHVLLDKIYPKKSAKDVFLEVM